VLRVEKGSRVSIPRSAGPLDAMGRPHPQTMPPRSTDLSDGQKRPYREHGTPRSTGEVTTALRSSV
jgi:hypothetical protein